MTTQAAGQCLQLGNRTILVEHDDFCEGYDTGYAGGLRHLEQEPMIGTSTLLFLLRNGWQHESISPTWQTGYIVGWLMSVSEACPGDRGKQVG